MNYISLRKQNRTIDPFKTSHREGSDRLKLVRPARYVTLRADVRAEYSCRFFGSRITDRTAAVRVGRSGTAYGNCGAGEDAGRPRRHRSWFSGAGETVIIKIY